MAKRSGNRLLAEQPLPRDGRERGARSKAPRTVTVNMAESPLGWLVARGLITARQFDAGDRLRADWERAQLGPCVTMRWDAPPTGKVARGAPALNDPTLARFRPGKGSRRPWRPWGRD